ncbi:Nitric oxide reductase [Georgfuchsia toluolica]|uniref:Nitric oxide reductase n=1 Tax=Georgfuchsia toluolica TaxID=424218 RepID=A0A916J3F0_9PROT|nr:VWA domain-containing protein [Georgfuchsia toluolica]CAG4883115.1 Nitric oxide reductase [Georgfuchsia toluolica]
MEEWVGSAWNKLITRVAIREYPSAAVTLPQMEKILGIVFRGLGGDPGLRVQQATAERHGARRSWLARMAGSADKTHFAGIDGASLNLPERIALFPNAELNRDLYLWLAALAAHDVPDGEWIVRNQRATVVALARFPGLESRYRRLVTACISQRIDPDGMPADEAGQERAIRAALNEPGTVSQLPPLQRRKAKALQPVPLWLYPLPGTTGAPRKLQHQDSEGSTVAAESHKRFKAERVDMPQDKNGMLMIFRAESLLSWAEYIKVNRSLDDDPDPDAARAAENLDQLSVAQDNDRVASRVRFDLDLPAVAEDDMPLGPGILLPEWDHRSRQLKRDYCKLQTMQARHAPAMPLPAYLRQQATRLRNQFACLAPARRWLKGQADGIEPDIDAWVRRQADRQAGVTDNSDRLYLTQVQQERDLACLVLADLSLSTDAWVSNEQKVIDVIRDSLLLFAEALSSTGDRFALCGFSSLKRGHVRYQELKSFAQSYDDRARGMVQAIRPGYYTRLGAAIRHSTDLLQREPCRQKLLLILSDGKPHDIDLYEGRYGIEDSRMSLNEARHQGIRPFCVTIDREGASYLPHLFGAQGYTLLRRPEELSLRLPLLYAQLTRN